MKIKRVNGANDLPLPMYATEGASGMDVVANIKEAIVLKPGERKLIPTGFSFQLKNGQELQVRPRSGLALKNGVTVLNAPGTIDSDYRGEVGVILINLGQEDFLIKRGDRIAQLVLADIKREILEEVHMLDDTERDDGGFGSTGV
ncbi:dUTP diphosphatase [Thomasclavelia cocleata]|uniref:dUTP diphosphatase n=1 Tax=Thomasclavelia cocleata TaxID=69824 RepID=UPI00272DF940|nr:dUTP diphosphatase [Thomasclavelia cocleata]